MNPGDLDKRVAIQVYTPALDPNGGQDGSWATVSTVWAGIQTLTGGKLEVARQIDAQASVQVRMRYCGTGGVANVTVDNRLLFGSRILEPILVVNENERNIMSQVLCKEKRGDYDDE
jgi:SPP1 family predicted phage head-tail adaptor